LIDSDDLTQKEKSMCYRPQPDLKRTPAKTPTNEEIDRRFQKLKAELAQLRERQESTRAG